MAEQLKKYGKLTADDLRVLLAYLPQLQEWQAEIDQALAGQHEVVFSPNGPQFHWFDCYEKPFPQHATEVVFMLGLTDEARKIGGNENLGQAMQGFIKNVDEALDDGKDEITPEQAVIHTRRVIALALSLMLSLRSLMVYGRYLNELIAEAREGKLHLRDKALLNAIRIDPTIVGCPTAIARISRAVMQQDEKFLKKVRNAMSGKLGKRESSTYQQIRLVLQVLYETGAQSLNDEELKTLFVKELNLYSDSAHTADKNIKEFAYNFKKQKSTI